jgi:hypothetical protein
MTKQDQVSKNSLSDLYQRLMSINQEAFTLDQYDIAYHTLMAALHCAQTLKDIAGLVEVEHVAYKQLESIDAHHPEYEHSTQSASKHGHPGIYKNLIKQARTRVRMIQQEENRNR